jgi:hypothetical protein
MEHPQPVLQTDDYIASLRSLVPSPSALQRKGYILSQLSSAELEKKRRCERCCKGA